MTDYIAARGGILLDKMKHHLFEFHYILPSYNSFASRNQSKRSNVSIEEELNKDRDTTMQF